MTLASLRKKLKRARHGRDRQSRLWRKTRKRGHGLAARRWAAKARNLRKRITDLTRVRWISPQGVKFIASWEGFPNNGRPYNDPVGYATVGYGHLLGYRPVNDADRRAIWVPGQKEPGRLTQAEARRLLRQKLRQSYEPPVRKLFTSGPLRGKFTQGLYDSLVSFAYNLGPGSVQGAAGFETLTAAIQSGSPGRIAKAMRLYDKAGGSALPGLTRRREAEALLAITGIYRNN